MKVTKRTVQGPREIFEVQSGAARAEFAVPLGVFEPSDIEILNNDEAQICPDHPAFEDTMRAFADIAWNARRPMRVEFFVSPELVPALTDNNIEGLSDASKYRVKQWSIQARQDNHDLFFTDGGIECEAVCEVHSDLRTCRQVFAHYNLPTRPDFAK